MASPDDNQSHPVAFDVGKAGSKASIEIHVSWVRGKLTHNNPQQVALMILPPHMNESNADLVAKYESLFKSLTGKNYIYKGDVPRESHKGIKVRVIWKDKGGKILRQQDVYSDDGNSRIKTVQGASFTLDGVVLAPGDYAVTVEALEDDSRFDGTFETAICTGYIVN